MTPEEWQRAKAILEVAVSCPTHERGSWIARNCGEDTRLRQEVESLLAAYEVNPGIQALLASGPPATDSTGQSGDRTRTASPAVREDPPIDADRAHVQPAVWGEFTLLEELGRGGFGVVYRAWDGSLKREIALKVIDVRRIRGTSEDTLLREGQMLARIRHENIVTVYSAQRIGSEVGLAMECIKGRTLANFATLQGPLSGQEAAVVGLKLCAALSAVHHEGLIHRDVKPSNIMRETGGRIVLMDFGASRELMPEPGTWSDVLGTPLYMSPEVLRGSRATPASDVYSLGVVLFYLVTGRYPVAGSGPAEILRAHAAGERTSLRSLRADLPLPLVAAVERALETNPIARTQTAAALERELTEAVRVFPERDSGHHERIGRDEAAPRADEEQRSREHRAWVTLPNLLVGLGCGLLFCFAVGFVTTLEFNFVLDRSGRFASESPWTYVTLGARSIIGPAIYVALVLVLFNAATLVVRLIAAFMPSLRARLVAVRDTSLAALRRFDLDDPNVLARLLCIAGTVHLAIVLWTFKDLLVPLGSHVSESPLSEFAAFHPDAWTRWALYRRLLELDLIALWAGLLAVLRIGRTQDRRVAVSAIVGVVIVALLAVLCIAGPWRTVFASKFRQAQLGNEACFVLGDDGPEVLLHCPAASPRNRIVRKDDTRLAMTEDVAPLFAAYKRP